MKTTAARVRVGGQALGDGVLMRTDRAWAIARADGSVEVGSMRPVRAARVPVVRVLSSLGGALSLAVGRGLLGRGRDGGGAGSSVRGQRPGGASRRFLYALGTVELAAIAFSLIVGRAALTGAASVAATAAPWVVTIAVLRVAAPGALWRYHGAEHKAVAAHEAGVDVADVDAVLRSSRVHDRCGTNLVFLLMVLGVPLANLPVLLQIPAVLVLLATTAELVSLAARRPRAVASRVLLAGGRSLQRWVTTAEPTWSEQQVGCRALLACMAEHARLTRSRFQMPAVAGLPVGALS